MIKTIRLNDDDFGYKLLQSFRETGFAIITEHGIPKDSLDNFYYGWESFFKDDIRKSLHLFDKETHAGYFPMASESAKDAEKPDLKEFYHYYPSKIDDPLMGDSEKMHRRLEVLATYVLNQLELQLPADVLDLLTEPLSGMIHKSEQTLLRILNYPALHNIPQGAVRAAEHEDINLITILPAATEMGLQVKTKAGEWLDVEANPGAMIINVGDMLQEATGGYLNSTPHRVINVGMSRARMSAPLFLHPRPEVRLSSRHTAHSYLQERLKELGLK